MIERYQRIIIAPDREPAALCDHYETLQRDKSAFYLKGKKRGENRGGQRREERE